MKSLRITLALGSILLASCDGGSELELGVLWGAPTMEVMPASYPSPEDSSRVRDEVIVAVRDAVARNWQCISQGMSAAGDGGSQQAYFQISAEQNLVISVPYWRESRLEYTAIWLEPLMIEAVSALEDPFAADEEPALYTVKGYTYLQTTNIELREALVNLIKIQNDTGTPHYVLSDALRIAPKG